MGTRLSASFSKHLFLHDRFPDAVWGGIHRHGHGGSCPRHRIPNAARGTKPRGPDAPSQPCLSSLTLGDRDAVLLHDAALQQGQGLVYVQSRHDSERWSQRLKRQALPPPRFMPGCRPKKSNADSKGGCRDICKCWRVPVRLAWALTRPTSVGCFMQAHPQPRILHPRSRTGRPRWPTRFVHSLRGRQRLRRVAGTDRASISCVETDSSGVPVGSQCLASDVWRTARSSLSCYRAKALARPSVVVLGRSL